MWLCEYVTHCKRLVCPGRVSLFFFFYMMQADMSVELTIMHRRHSRTWVYLETKWARVQHGWLKEINNIYCTWSISKELRMRGFQQRLVRIRWPINILVSCNILWWWSVLATISIAVTHRMGMMPICCVCVYTLQIPDINTLEFIPSTFCVSCLCSLVHLLSRDLLGCVFCTNIKANL